MSSSTRSSLVAGALLVALGLLFLAGQVLDISVLNFTWPFIIIGTGALFFVAMFLGGKSLGALAIPGSIISGIGLILLVQNALNLWESWSYSWALIVFFVGLGIFIHGSWSGLPEAKASGLRVMRIGLVLFLIFGVFFGLLFSLTGVYGLGSGLVWAVLLIVLGGYMFVARMIRWARRSEEAGTSPVKFFWPVVFMGVGALWLLVTMNILPAEQALALLNLWPILLIVGGIDLIIGRRFTVVNLLLGLVTVAVLFFFAFAGPAFGLNKVSVFDLGWVSFNNGFPTQMITGSGNASIAGREISGFDSVRVRTFGEVEITQGDTTSVVIEADDNLLPYLTTSVLGGRLELGIKEGYSVTPKTPIRYKITVKELKEVDNSGAARVTITDLTTNSLDLDSSGAGEFDLRNLSAGKLEVQISGVGSIKASGESDVLDLNISGAGSFAGAEFKNLRAKVNLSGAGSATLWVTEKLDTSISGVGSISYYGSPDASTQHSGLGTTRRLGDK